MQPHARRYRGRASSALTDRLTRISYPTGVATVLEYDGGASPTPAAIGELTKVTDESGTTSYSFDSLGRMISKTTIVNGKTFTVGYSWGDTGSAIDKLTAITYPSGSRANYSYDLQGYVSGVSVNPVNASGNGLSATSNPLLSAISYNADNNPTGWLWADGKARSISYDSFGQIAAYSLGDPAGTGIAAGTMRTLIRDAAGRITGYSHSNNSVAVPSLNQSFGYDNLNRLINATLGTNTATASTSQYSYDASGNRTAKVIGATSYANTVDTSSNKLLQTQDTTGTASYSHDAAGNVTGDGINTFSYSDRGRMSSVTNAGGTVNYLYNGLSQRVSKTGPTGMVPTGAAYFVYDEQGQLLGEYDANQNPIFETIYLGATPVGVMKQTGSAGSSNIAVALYNVYSDHLMTPRVITRASDEAIVWRWDTAEAFGATAANQNPNSLGTFVFNQRFPGQMFDAETGLLQNWYREYDPRQGRYRQSDPIGLDGGINTYSYVEGNPISSVDRKGLDTYSCTRPLEGARNISFGPFYHQFLCTLDSKGKVSCSGLGPTGGSSGMFGSPGKIETETSVRPEQCEKIRGPDIRFESCIQEKLGGPLPWYDVRAGGLWGAIRGAQQCQSFAQSVLAECAAKYPH